MNGKFHSKMDTVRAFFTKSGHFFWIFMIGQWSSPPSPRPPSVTCLLYYTILHYTTLHYTIIYYTILNYTLLYSTLLYSTILLYKPTYYTIITLFHHNRKYNQNNKILHLIWHMRCHTSFGTPSSWSIGRYDETLEFCSRNFW